jgi:hypothetical protein
MTDKIAIRLQDASGSIVSEALSSSLAVLDIRYRAYEQGDLFIVDVPGNRDIELMLDSCLAPSIVRIPGGHMEFPVPFGIAREPYGQEAFSGDCHWAYARTLNPKEQKNWRNLALNSYDLEGTSQCFPHASTNSGATNPRFLARNAIDGVFQTCHHGRFPYESWGVNGRTDAWLRVDFGRMVYADSLVFFLRADFPHDTWWKSIRITCSDESEFTAQLNKSGEPQTFKIGPRPLEWIRLSNLQVGDNTARWPALSQIMVMGRLI